MDLHSSIQKLRAIIRHIMQSESRQRRFEELATGLHNDLGCLLVRDTPTRVQTTIVMISRAIPLQKAVDEWVSRHKELENNYLSCAEWNHLKSCTSGPKLKTRTKLLFSQLVLPLYSTMTNADDEYHSRQTVVESICELAKKLPDSIEIAEKTDRIYTVMKNLRGKNNWHTFNRRFDALFAQDILDKHGHFPDMRRGRHGIEYVASYIQNTALDLPHNTHAALMLKLQRLDNELKRLCGTADTVHGEASAQPKTQLATSKPPREKPQEKERTEEDLLREFKQGHLARALYGHEQTLIKDNRKDKTYRPPARSNDNRSSEESDESDDEGGLGVTMRAKGASKGAHKRLRVDSTSSERSETSISIEEASLSEMAKVLSSAPKETMPAAKSTAKGKQKSNTKQSKRRRQDAEVVEVVEGDSEQSDGNSALRAMKEREAKARPEGSRGPVNKSLEFWHGPKAVRANGEKRWEFTCKLCRKIRTFDRTVDSSDFSKEQPRPKLGNLATHLNVHGAEIAQLREKEKDGGNSDELLASSSGSKVLERQQAIMARMLDDGKVNPSHSPSQPGFHRRFTAYILESNHPLTAGEAPALRILFEYIKCPFKLPSDTAVGNFVSRIHKHLQGAITKELAASIPYRIAYSTDSWTNPQMIYTFCATLATWIDEKWTLRTRLIDFRHLAMDEHTGKGLAKAFWDAAPILASLKIVDDEPGDVDYYEKFNKYLPVAFDLAMEDEDLEAIEAEDYDGDEVQDPDTSFTAGIKSQARDEPSTASTSALEKAIELWTCEVQLRHLVLTVEDWDEIILLHGLLEFLAAGIHRRYTARID
ncbi:hypothetical protein CONPUDRAFT_71621 [Coniophora puteana RWD-64-598 SS2]|uniref:BED-type domain-containing protein n=1 Tax=Coniophora puteana (strain RWD-64-598) TaxID=741705 RepID=A0A5M3MVD0_CONPW|nr:uncharacterized protein CONPUDRAFT_71621 [Coniophora puteana RWD-64-598 SS2]EIW82967.1 hypothetical protein CONPUDRAFT_71621 [Coniophora puteana RWD-64-598 SS2]